MTETISPRPDKVDGERLLNLTQAELEWLEANKTVRVAVKDGWMPIEFKLESRRHQGISVDYLSEISNLLGINFEVVDYVDSMNAGKADVISGVSNPKLLPQDFQALDQPFLILPQAIYVNKLKRDPAGYAKPEMLEGKRVAIYRHGAVINEIRAKYPKIILVPVDIADEAFERLEHGDVDAYIGNELIIDYHISFNRLGHYYKAGVSGINTPITMGVRSDWPEFKSILEKSLYAVGQNNRGILTKWRTLEQPVGFFGQILLALLSVVLIGILIKLYLLKRRLNRESAEAQRNIWKQANFDYVTDLPNRHLFKNRLDQALSRSQRSGLSIGLLFIDLDNFKHVNDQYGHSFGDQLIAEAARRINATVRSDDTAARFGGDEFVVLVMDIHDHLFLESIAKKILDALQQPFYIRDKVLMISASIGISIYPHDCETSEDLLSFADKAMYEAKKLGRNRMHFFTQSIQAQSIKRLSIAHDFRSALLNRQFELHYQPIIRLKDERVMKAEALIRWNHPQRGIISPVEFIPIAEETGFIKELGQWVFEQACTDLAAIRQVASQEFQLSFNVSPVQFRDAAKLSSWLAHLEANNLPGESLVIEITEGLLLDASDEVTKILSGFRKAGIEISIDDFGTGYSALSYLKKFDIDYVKIDKSFIQSLAHENYDAVLCDAIIQMAHKLGIKIVAEGVETEVQKQLLMQFDCDYIQGYLYAKPGNLQQLLQRLGA